MAATTRWKDTVVTDFEESIVKLLDGVVSDERISNISWDNWLIQKVFENNHQVNLCGHMVEYNVVRYAYDQTTTNELSPDDRTIRKEGLIIVYKNGEVINYIIDQNTSAMKLLRKLLSYTGRNELEKNSFEFTDDFFMWLIYRVYNANYSVEMVPGDRRLQVDSIKGFKGDTEDSLTQVSATGESVMNIISTLSFILESSSLNQIKLNLDYMEHPNISIKLQRNTVNIYFEEYQGCFERDGYEDRYAKIYLMVYLEILPYLVQEYDSDLGNDAWGRNVKIQFMKDVASTLMEKVQNRINSIEIAEKIEESADSDRVDHGIE